MSCELQCYRKGCGKSYDPETNRKDSCRYHPGAPVFHDALKGWSCCDRKSTDFSVFLDMPGCTLGFHSNEKPPPLPKVESKPLPDEMVIRGPPPKTATQHLERPDPNSTKTVLSSTVGATLKQALEKRMGNLGISAKESSSPGGEVSIGTACKNNSCKSHYEGTESNNEECKHHPGVPIFHEGMKYWSCCQKKTTEFDKFMDQEGCELGRHRWVATAKETAKQKTCRVDWHQTGGNVIITVFSKCADPSKTIIKANQVAIDIYVVYEDDKVYSDCFELNGIINLEKSNVKLLGTKVEITLKKAEAESWAQLKYVPHNNSDAGDPN